MTAHLARTSLTSRWRSPAGQLRHAIQTRGRSARPALRSATKAAVSAPPRAPSPSKQPASKSPYTKTIVRPRAGQLTSTYTSAQLAYRYGFPILGQETLPFKDAVAGQTLPFSAANVYKLSDLTDITRGRADHYSAGPGYDLLTGMGVPNSGFTKAWLEENGSSGATA